MSASTHARAPSPLRKLRYLLEAAGFFLLIGFFRLFSIDRASAIGGWFGRTVIAPTRFSELARENLRTAFPEKSDAERESILRAMWDNLGRVMAEYGHLDKIHWRKGTPRIEVSGLEHVEAARARGTGILLVSAHFANWEIMPFTAREYGFDGATVVRPANNPHVNAWLEKMRKRNGMPEIIAKAQGTRRIFTLLRRNGCICMLVDQRASEGILAPFFGREAQTTPAPAALALKLGAVILPVSNERTGGARFHMRVYPPIVPPDTSDSGRDLVDCTAAINAFVEARVRERPEQWLWIHRRWVDPGAALRRRAQLLSRGGATKATSSRV